MKNPFLIFQIEPAFELDMDTLTKQYRTLITTHHADKIAQDTSISMEDINIAYALLKHPTKRARALLTVAGVTIEEDQIISDPILLEEIFELRMANDSVVTTEKRDQALQQFAKDFAKKDVSAMLNGYLRLLYLDKALISDTPL